jgi:tetratricopeptide (TPR) repeat protein
VIRSRLLIVLAVTPVVLGTALASAQRTDGVYAQAEALLTAGKLEDARSLLEASLDTTPDDPRALLLLGRVHFAWPVVGRYEAKKLFERTAALTPDDPEPLYWLMRVGVELKDAEGEQLAWKSIARAWALDPDYRDTWAVWRRMYHGSGQLRQALDVLSRHAGNLVVDFRRAQLQLELGQLREADSMLADLIARGRADGGVWALRAEIAFALSDTAAGTARYARAVESAATDTLDVLWQQIASIASSGEKAAYTRAPAERRPAFLRAFWALRDPDLTTAANERLAEHFGRLAYARRQYRLRFPWSRIHSSPEYRALNAPDLAAYMLRRVKAMSGTVGRLPELSPDEERRQLLGLGVSLRDVPEPDSVTRYVQLGLDGRGVAYVRFGPPKRKLVDIGGVVERWEYQAGGGRFSLSFAVVGGDYILSPVSPLELDNIRAAVELDSTSVTAPLELQAWNACFRAATPGLTLLYVGMDAESAGTAVWDTAGLEILRVQGAPPLTLTLPPGSYRIGADGRLDGRLGRLRTQVDVPDLWSDPLAISCLLAARVQSEQAGRDAIVRSMPAPLRFAADEPLLLYAELYGLGSSPDGRARYSAEYEFAPTDSAHHVSLRFTRNPPVANTVPERLVISPGQVERGRYAITLRIWDEIRRQSVGTSRIYVELR